MKVSNQLSNKEAELNNDLFTPIPFLEKKVLPASFATNLAFLLFMLFIPNHLALYQSFDTANKRFNELEPRRIFSAISLAIQISSN